MWNRVVDSSGKYIPGGIDRFKAILRTEHRRTVKVSMLDTDFQPIDGGELFSKDVGNDLTNFITDGNIDVDVSRGTRRTAELTLLNPTADFTPNTEGFVSDGDWVGKVYLNRVVRIYSGVYDGNQRLYVPVGTFFIDNIDVQVEQNMSQVVLTMSDRWKTLTKSSVGPSKRFESGTHYNTIINWFLDAANIPNGSRNLDPITGRDRTIDKDLIIHSGDNRGEVLKDLADKWSLDVYFDPMGHFNSHDLVKDRSKPEVWKFYSSEDQDGMLINIRRTFNDDNLYNHVVVVGLVNKKPFRLERVNDNPASKMSVNRIGDRVFYLRDDRLNTAEKVRNALNKAWRIRVQVSESMEIKTICNPLLEADNIIRITERDFAKVDDRYRLSAFNIPLVSSLQTIMVNKILREEDI